MRKFFILAFTLLTLTANAERKKVGLILGGGGAKGAAHIGVLKVLEEAEIPIDYIGGTSIGAIVGALYSIGYDSEAMDSLVNNLDWAFLLSNNNPQTSRTFRARDIEGKYVLSIPYSKEKKITIPAGIVNGQNILNLFSGLTVGYHDTHSFDSLPIPFNCVATNLVSENYVVLNKGDLPLSMRSSMSIPGFFMPVKMDSMILVDGGVLNNFPTNVVKDMGADILIGIDLSTGPVPVNQLQTMEGLINKLVDITGKEEYKKNLKGLDLYMNPDLKGYGTMDFNKAAMDSMYTYGEQCARQHWNKLMEIKKEIYGDTIFKKQEELKHAKYITPKDTLFVESIHINGVSEKLDKFLRKQINLEEHKFTTVNDINEAIATLDGMEVFSSVTYKLLGKDKGPYNLIFNLEEEPLNHINIGVRFDTESLAALLLNTTVYEDFFRGSKFSATARLSSNPYLNLLYEWRPTYWSNIGFGYNIGYSDYSLFSGKHKIENISYLWQNGIIKFGTLLDNWEFNAGIMWEHFGYSKYLYNTDATPLHVSPQSFFNYFISMTANSLDNLYYPTKGVKAHFNAKLYTDNFVSYKNDAPFASLSYDVELPFSIGRRFTVIPALQGRFLFGNNVSPIYQNYGGGHLNSRYLEQQIAIPGVQNVQIFDNALGFAKLDLRYRIGKNHYTYLLGGYGRDSEKLHKIDHGSNIWFVGAKYSYNTPIGPVSGEIDYANVTKRVTLFFNLGYYF